MKKIYLFIILFALLIIGYFAYISLAYLFYQRSDKICMQDVCNIEEDTFLNSYVYATNGYCACFHGQESWKRMTVDPFTGKISDVIYEPIE